MSESISMAEKLCNKSFPVKITIPEMKHVSSSRSMEEMLNYLYYMAAALDVDLSKKKLGDFGVVLDKKFHPQENMKLINSVLTREEVGEDVTFNEVGLHVIKKYSTNFTGTDQSTLDSKLSGLRADARTYMRRHHGVLQKIKEEIHEAKSKAFSTPDFLSMLLATEAGGFWKVRFNSYSEYIYIENKNPIVINYKNEKQGIDATVNFGTISFELRPGATGVNPCGGSKSVRDGDYYHPHVSNDSICWGELYEDYSDASTRGDLIEVFRLLKEIVTSYNHDDPFLGIGHWIATYDPDYEGPTDIPRDECDNCGCDGGSCDCSETCEGCGYHPNDCACDQGGEF